MIVNKLDQQMKKTMGTRIRSGLLMALYGFSILYCLTLADKSKDGWSRYIPYDTHNVVSFIFAIISVLAIAWITIFIAIEMHNCFIRTSNKKQIVWLAITMLLIQLIPTFIWITPSYFPLSHLQIWFICFISSAVLLIVMCYPFYLRMVKNGNKSTKFNVLVFPFVALGIAVGFGLIYYLCIVRYWTTIVVILFVVCGCDIMAYFSGVLFGKHKMAPIISPKKSWEGAIIGSFITATLGMLIIFLFSLIAHEQLSSSMDVPYNFFGVQFSNYFSNWYSNPLWWIIVTILIILLTILVIFGDLFFSLLKRKNNIKDFGNGIPGHGGYLDRIDSFIVVVLVFGIITFFVSLSTSIYNTVVHGNFEYFNTVFPDWFR